MKGLELTVKIDDVLIAYDDLGSGKIPVIFIHGFPFNKSTWKPQMEELSKTYRTIAYDIRGFGKSDSGSEPFSIDLFAGDLIAFMNALKIDTAIVCGLSMGGYILLNAVNLFPDRFSVIILCDTQCISDTEEVREGRKKTIEFIEEGNKIKFTDDFTEHIFCTKTIREKPEIVTEVRNTILETSVKTLTEALTALAKRNETCSVLNKIVIPALILCGESDTVTPPDQSRLMKNRISGATMRIISDAGHMSNLEQSVDFNNNILRFLKDRVG